MGELLDSVTASTGAMTWLTPTDSAAITLACAYAKRIDAAISSDFGEEITKALYLGPHLLNTLRALGGTPAERKSLGIEGKVSGKLAELRAVSSGKPAAARRAAR